MQIMLTLPAAARLRGRNVLTVTDLGADELAGLIALGQTLKARGREQLMLLRGKTLVMLFEKPSLRTRVSFEAGMTHSAVTRSRSTAATSASATARRPRMPPGSSRATATRSSTAPTSTSRWCASLAPRRCRRSTRSPRRPTRARPWLTCSRSASGSGRCRGCGLPSSATRATTSLSSVAEAAAMSGMSMTFAAPMTHRPTDAFLTRLVKLGEPHGVTARAFTSPIRAVRDVDVVYTDVWTSMGDEQFSRTQLRGAASLSGRQRS